MSSLHNKVVSLTRWKKKARLKGTYLWAWRELTLAHNGDGIDGPSPKKTQLNFNRSQGNRTPSHVYTAGRPENLVVRGVQQAHFHLSSMMEVEVTDGLAQKDKLATYNIIGSRGNQTPGAHKHLISWVHIELEFAEHKRLDHSPDDKKHPVPLMGQEGIEPPLRTYLNINDKIHLSWVHIELEFAKHKRLDHSPDDKKQPVVNDGSGGIRTPAARTYGTKSTYKWCMPSNRPFPCHI
ncbi:hypothetical protein C8R46DRAFT_1024278 [Mycena filopes]|nr:hypothetical protein C8R46DRAFT_1024278 [Mycena filopes]